VLRQRYPGKKVVAVGYSFGGILTLQHLGGETPEPVDGVVLIAAPSVDEVVELEDFAVLDAFAETQINAGNDVDAWSDFRTLAEGQAAAHAELPPRQYFDDYVKQRLSRCNAMEHELELSWIPEPAEQAGEIDPNAALVVPGKFVGARILDWLVPELVSFDLRAEAARIQLPALLLWGEDDCQVALSAGQQLLEDLGSAQKRLVSRAHAGHQLPYQEPDFVAHEIEQFVDAL
jgi:pimeloyl-ACP methyl ester carboxylesterase